MSKLAHSNETTMNIIEIQSCLEEGSVEFITDEEQYLFDRLLSGDVSVETAIHVLNHNKNSVVKGVLLSFLRNIRSVV